MTTPDRFWADDFDADLLKTVPAAAEILAPVGGCPLVTRGHVTTGRLNHPTVWNQDVGLTAFFAFGGDPRPSPQLYTTDPIVECTFAEAIRDAWIHTIVVVIERQVVFNAFALRQEFEALMYWTRKWCDQPDPVYERTRVAIALKRAVETFIRLGTAKGQF